MNRDWKMQANILFQMEKPVHFTNYKHCDECAEHDETLRTAELQTIGLDELGNPGWGPICFCSDEGKRYLAPAFIRLTLDTLDNEFYLEQFLFHLQGDGIGNSYFDSCCMEQRTFIAEFLCYLLENYSELIDKNLCGDDLLRAYEIWSQ